MCKENEKLDLGQAKDFGLIPTYILYFKNISYPFVHLHFPTFIIKPFNKI